MSEEYKIVHINDDTREGDSVWSVVGVGRLAIAEDIGGVGVGRRVVMEGG